MRKFRIQLMSTLTGKAIAASGGVAYVATHDGAAKATLYDADGAALSNPVALTNGVIEFYTADAVNEVDLYIQAPSGHFVVAKGIIASGPSSLFVDATRVDTTMVIPFSIDDTTATTETDTGFDIPDKAHVLPFPSVDVLTLDATETIDVGTLTGDSGDPDGFLDGASVATATHEKGTLLNSGVTLGNLLKVQDSINAGDAAPEASSASEGKSVSYTLSAGTDTAEGFIILPLKLAHASL